LGAIGTKAETVSAGSGSLGVGSHGAIALELARMQEKAKPSFFAADPSANVQFPALAQECA
jgi:hypothetical protein